MDWLLTLKRGWALALYAALDIVCVGIGMGVPIMCILLGLPVGWYLAERIAARHLSASRTLRDILLGAALTSAFTFALMALLWGRCLPMLFDPAADLANFGIPMILYEPVASFVAWLALMIVISPFLQFLMTLCGAQVTLWWLWRGGGTDQRQTGSV